MKKFLLPLALVSSVAFAVEPIPENENPRLFTEGKAEITSLLEVDRLGLNSGATSLDLWSGSYWPHYQGALGVRYRDPKFAAIIKDKSQFDKFKDLKVKLPTYSYSGRENLLSPAEKYDLIVGDPKMSLTKYAWELGEDSATFGKVKTWRGICDGWASAAQKMPRPVRNVILKTPSGMPVTFFPEDIKALGSLLYARNQGPVIFLGERCEGGLFSGKGCKETNPGTFHRALVNRVGNMKKTFIADVSPGGDVWNYPVQSYKLTYYNVFNDEDSETVKEAMEIFDKKKFSKSDKRHKLTYAVVGVTAVVNYMDMRPANLLSTDGVENDKIMTKTYYYDLELDRNLNVIGGESFSKDLPDFIWAPNDKTYPTSDAEEQAEAGASLVTLSQQAAKSGQPISTVVQKLFEAAK
ncbi:MAG TPA: hypothetical protein VNJ01_15730 [Bacteriovoracaceae bacterium]|nr:hypothetical protein [Bacteriovoracaceae bacterium]